MRNPKPHLKQLLPLGAVMLLTACGGDNFYKQFTATPALWRNADAPSESPQYDSYSRQYLNDTDGSTWAASTSTDGFGSLRKLDNAGNELWQRDLPGWPYLIARTGTGAVVVDYNPSATAVTLSAIDSDGNTDWQVTPIPTGYNVRSLHTSAGDEVLVSAIRVSGGDTNQLRAIRLDADGALLWSTPFDIPNNGLDFAHLVATSGGQSLLILQSGSNLTTRVLNANGQPGPEKLINADTRSWIEQVQPHGDGFAVETSDALYLLKADGALAWQYRPEGNADGFDCSMPDATLMACARGLPGMQVVVDWLKQDGTIDHSKTFAAMDRVNDFIGDGQGRWVLVENREPDTVDATLELAAGIDIKRYATRRLHVLDDAGTTTQVVNLLSGRAMPSFSLYGGPITGMTITGDHERYQSAFLHGDQLIVAGTLVDLDNLLPAQQPTKRSAFITGFALE